MPNKRKRISTESKIDLILLAIGLILIMWIVISREEVRKGYAVTADIRTEYAQTAETFDYMYNDVVKSRITERIGSIISQEFLLGDKKLEILSVNSFASSTIATFIYGEGEEACEGICQISDDDNIIFKAVDPVNSFEPFTLHEVEFKKENIPSCTVIYGVVNNPVIKSININFYDNTMVNIILGKDIGYSYINEEGAVPIMRVEGLDEALNIFYQWEKIYMNNV